MKWITRQERHEKALQKSLKGVTSAKGVRDNAVGVNPLLTSRTPVWRSRLLVAGLAFGFTGLVARAAYVQIFDNAFFLRQGQVRYARTIEMPANRGRILDRNGLILASSVPAQSIFAFPSEIDREGDAAKLHRMAQLLGMSDQELGTRLGSAKNFVYVKRQVDEGVAEQIAALGIKGIDHRKEYRRQYPEGEAVSHIVGFTDVEDKGQEGIERTFDQQLAGKPGSRRVIRDRLGRVIEGVGEQVPPVDGRDIRLTIDSKIQYFAWQKLRDAVKAQDAKGGSVVVLDVRTGEILALANYPSYDPNDRRDLTGEQLRNRALTDTYEPGSIIKPLTVALALQERKVTPNTIIETSPGRLTIAGATIGDTHNYGTLTVEGVVQKSSNVGTVKISERLEAHDMWDNFMNMGLGQKPDLPFPGIGRGRVRPWKAWRPIEKATMAYGYGLSASLFQMARAYSVFAHDGVMMPITLVQDNMADASGRLHPVDKSRGVRVYSPAVAREILHTLHLVTLPGGTAQQAQTVGYSVGGKTGTARKLDGTRYSTSRYRGSFVGIAPIEAPRIVVGVMIDEPKSSIYGGLTAAPVFSDVVQQTLRILGVQPDMSVRPGVITDEPEESL